MHATETRDAAETVQADLADAERWPLFLLASMLVSYPDETFASDVTALIGEPDLSGRPSRFFNGHWLALEERLRELLASPVELDEVRSDYVDSFERGQAGTPLYESEYQRERAMQKANVLADLAGFYLAFGLRQPEGGSDMPDHIAVELEFYSFLLMKQARAGSEAHAEGGEVVLDARRKFMQDHLGPLALAVTTRPGLAGHVHYGTIFPWLHDLVLAECRRLGIAAEALSWVPGSPEAENMECAVSCAATPAGQPA